MENTRLQDSNLECKGQGGIDRRKDQRFAVRDGGVALVTPPGPVSTIVGHIIDVSLGGLSFGYVSDEGLSDRASEVTIASPEHKFYLRRLPIQAISDFEVAKMPFGMMSPRRYGLKFGQLTEEQVGHLRNFIVNHTVEAEPAEDVAC